MFVFNILQTALLVIFSFIAIATSFPGPAPIPKDLNSLAPESSEKDDLTSGDEKDLTGSESAYYGYYAGYPSYPWSGHPSYYYSHVYHASPYYAYRPYWW